MSDRKKPRRSNLGFESKTDKNGRVTNIVK